MWFRNELSSLAEVSLYKGEHLKQVVSKSQNMINLNGMAIGNGCISGLTSYEVQTEYNNIVILTDFGLPLRVKFRGISCFNPFLVQ